MAEAGGADTVEAAFKEFFTADSCREIHESFSRLLQTTGVQGQGGSSPRSVYCGLRNKLQGCVKAKPLLDLLDKKAAHPVYEQGKACASTRVLIVGAGPCGLRTAIECALLGARTVVVEKRSIFSRNNVLHLWPFLITDLKSLGAKLFFPRFCAGSLDHISIRKLQIILLKVVLLLGIEVHFDVSFEGLREPSKDKNDGWRIQCTPAKHPSTDFQFDVIIGAGGKHGALDGFTRRELRGKLAIAITANFVNHNTKEDAQAEEISGVAAIYNQQFFADLREKTGIDLENIVYYKDDTHYFVMTAKKQSLLERGVLKQNHADVVALLKADNVDQNALMVYAQDAAMFSTNYKLQFQEFAKDHREGPDIAVFDFTSMFAADNACSVREQNGHRLLLGLVGDVLLEPFWPMGTGCARGFLGAFDAAWMIRNWSKGEMTSLKIIAERESIYSILSQTTPERVIKCYEKYTIDPKTRYPSLNKCCLKPKDVRHLYHGAIDPKELEDEAETITPKKLSSNKQTNVSRADLLQWCQQILNTGSYPGVNITDFSVSWHSGLAFCALIHAFYPKFIKNMSSLPGNRSIAEVNQLAFDVARRELGLTPAMTGREMANCEKPDELTVIAYLSQFYLLFKNKPLGSANVKNNQTKVAERPKRLIPEKIDTLPRNVKNATLEAKKKDQSQMTKTQKKTEKAASSGLSRNGEITKVKQDDQASGKSETLLPKEKKKLNKKKPSGKKNNAKKEKAKRSKQQKTEQVEEVRSREDRQRRPSDGSPSDVKAKIEMFGGKKTTDSPPTNAQQDDELEPAPSLFCGLCSRRKKSKKADKTEENTAENVQLAKLPQQQSQKVMTQSQALAAQSNVAETGGKVKALREKLEQKHMAAEESAQNKQTEMKGSKAPVANPHEAPAENSVKKQRQTPQVLPASNMCYFCHERVYLMERLTAEGLFFHHRCFKCTFCQVELRIINYESERLRDGIVKFYCARHATPEKRIETGIHRRKAPQQADPKGMIKEVQNLQSKEQARAEPAQIKKSSEEKPMAEDARLEEGASPSEKAKDEASSDATPKKGKEKKKKEVKPKKSKASATDTQSKGSGDQKADKKSAQSSEEPDGVKVADTQKADAVLPSLSECRQALKKLLSKAPKIKTSGSDYVDYARVLLEDEKQISKNQDLMATLQRKRADQQRLFAAQELQRRLQEIDLRMQELEELGKKCEKEIRDKGTDYDMKDQAMSKWMNLVKEKNILMRHESKLVLRAKELELEDMQTRLHLKFNEASQKPDEDKTPKEIEEERKTIAELMNVVKQRIALAVQLKEDKHREEEEDAQVEKMMKKNGYLLVPLSYSHQLELGSVENLASPT